MLHNCDNMPANNVLTCAWCFLTCNTRSTRLKSTNATKQNFAAFQCVQHFSQLPVTHPSSTKSHIQTMKLTPPPSAITHKHHLPQSRSYTEAAAAVPVPQSEIPPSSVPGTHRSTEPQRQTSHRRKLHSLVREPKKIKQQHTSSWAGWAVS